MKHSTLASYTLLGTLYFAQGLPFGFFFQALPVMLRDAGHSLGEVGLASLLALPWAAKWLWAPFVDRWHLPRLGRRRTWILGMQLAATVVLCVLAVLPSGDTIPVLLAAVLMLNLIAATQDIATDGMAIALLKPEERGFANGLQVAGYRVGMVVGGGVLLGLLAQLGFAKTFAVMAALTALATLPVIAAREPEIDGDGASDPRGSHFLQLPGVWRLIGLVVIYKAGEAFAQGMLRPFLKDQGLSLADIGWMVGTIGFVAGMAGAIAGGLLVTRLGRRRSLVLFGVGQAVTVAGYAVLASGAPSRFELAVWLGAEHFASGMATAALFTAMMDWSRPERAGTDYSVQASAVVIATGVAAALSGFSAQWLGYGLHFALAAGLCVVSVAGVHLLFPQDRA